MKPLRAGTGVPRPGRHAARPTRSRTSLSVSQVVGISALALVTTGSVHAGPAGSAVTALSAPQPASTSMSESLANAPIGLARAGTSGTATRLVLEREVRISRDSSRQALSDATGTELDAPGGAKGKEANAGLAELAADAEKAAAEIARNAWQLPVAAGSYRLSATFGQCSSLWSHCHTGLDFAAPSGTPILAIANGVITETAYAGAYGNRTIMTLEDGTELWYCHQTSFVAGPGEAVVAGQTIGYVGSTGNSTGPHLHLEVRPGGGDPVDPYQALAAKGDQP
jgi:murein DD-endopeptidase MepM/ murein hydrolase activator NlpD